MSSRQHKSINAANAAIKLEKRYRSIESLKEIKAERKLKNYESNRKR